MFKWKDAHLNRLEVGCGIAALPLVLVLLAGIILVRGLDLASGRPAGDGRVPFPLNPLPSQR